MRWSALLLLAAIGCGQNDGGVGPIFGNADLAFSFPIDLSAGGGCSPIFSGVESAWRPPVAHQGQCGDAELDAFAQALGAGDLQAFNQLAIDHPACDLCLEGNGNQGEGPYLRRAQGFFDGNVGACVALLDSPSSSCGRDVNAQDECAASACGNCPVRIRADLVAYDLCRMQAVMIGAPCGQYATDCASLVPQAAVCEPGHWASGRDWFRYLGGLLCGAPGDL
jgi:hypothetical protein